MRILPLSYGSVLAVRLMPPRTGFVSSCDLVSEHSKRVLPHTLAGRGAKSLLGLLWLLFSLLTLLLYPGSIAYNLLTVATERSYDVAEAARPSPAVAQARSYEGAYLP